MAQDIGIDLGTANIVMAVSGKGIVLSEPSVIAINKRTRSVMLMDVEDLISSDEELAFDHKKIVESSDGIRDISQHNKYT